MAWCARRCVDATGVAVTWEEIVAGSRAREQSGLALPPPARDRLVEVGRALCAPLDGGGENAGENPGRTLRQAFRVFAAARTCRFGALRGRPAGDLLLIRPEPEPGGDAAGDAGREIPLDPAAARAFLEFSFGLAAARGRRRVTLVHRATRFPRTDGAWLDLALAAARAHPGLAVDTQLAPHVAMQLARSARPFDVLIAADPWGELLAETATGAAGGLGMVAETLYGTRGEVFTCAHGTASRHAGLDAANPVGMILAGAGLLRSLGAGPAAASLESAVDRVVQEGLGTVDFTPFPRTPSARGTLGVAEAVMELVRRAPPDRA